MILYDSMQAWCDKATELFGEDSVKWKFVCPCCGNIQSIEDFQAKTSLSLDEIKGVVHFSCIGRWVKKDKESKSPCDYTAGGLFNLTTVRVKMDDVEHSSFDFYQVKEV